MKGRINAVLKVPGVLPVTGGTLPCFPVRRPYAAEEIVCFVKQTGIFVDIALGPKSGKTPFGFERGRRQQQWMPQIRG
jgi:hypothetical protein